MIDGGIRGAIGLGEEDKIDDMVNSIVDEALADIVLVKKNEMEEWQRRSDKLKYELNLTKKRVE
jgi:hypothetical protein